MTQIDHVDVYINSKKVFLKGARKNTSIPFGKVAHFTAYKDGLQIEKSGNDAHWLALAAAHKTGLNMRPIHRGRL